MTRMSRTFQDAAIEQLARESDRANTTALERAAEKLLEPLRNNPDQLAVCMDKTSRFIAMRCARGGGKSMTIARDLYRSGILYPKSPNAYVTYTLKMAKRLMWEPLKALNDEYEIGVQFQNADLIATLPNGSWIELGGVETLADIDKFRGRPFKKFWIDEGNSISRDLLYELIHEAVKPRMNDLMGTIGLAGTPGYVLAGEFHDATPNDPQVTVEAVTKKKRAYARPYRDRDLEKWSGCKFVWSVHTWTLEANPLKVPCEDGTYTTLWAQALEDKERRGWGDTHPSWLREYLGRWAAKNSELVYHGFHADRNLWTPGPTSPDNPFGLPEGPKWEYGFGCDLGFDNDFALQVIAFADDHPNFYQVYESGGPGMHVTAVAEMIHAARAHLPSGQEFLFMVGDRGALGTMIFAELERVHGMTIEPADKHQRLDHIEILNGELLDGRCKLMDRIGNRLRHEFETVPWKDDKKKEIPREAPHDYSDAFRYLSTRTLHHLGITRVCAPRPGSPEALAACLAEHERKMFEPPKRGQIDRSYVGKRYDKV